MEGAKSGHHKYNRRPPPPIAALKLCAVSMFGFNGPWRAPAIGLVPIAEQLYLVKVDSSLLTSVKNRAQVNTGEQTNRD